jgi:hypothetical protein
MTPLFQRRCKAVMYLCMRNLVGQDEYGHVYVEATSMPLSDMKDLMKNKAGINLKVSRGFRRVQGAKNNE